MLRPSRRPTPAPTFVEPLEARQFLSADVAACTADVAAVHTNQAAIVAKAVTASPGQTIFGESAVGVKLKFKKTKALPGNGIAGFVHESGTFTDEKGNSGTYQLVIPPKLASNQPVQVLNLNWKKKVNLSRGITFQFTPISKRLNAGLNGKTVTFVSKAAGTSAKGVMTGASIVNVYLKY